MKKKSPAALIALYAVLLLSRMVVAQCAGDHECKGNRRCVDAKCVSWAQSQSPAPASASVTSQSSVEPQRSTGGSRVGLKPLVGFNLTRTRAPNELYSLSSDWEGFLGESLEYSIRSAFSAGLAVDLRFGRVFSLEPGVIFTIKKFGIQHEFSYIYDDEEYTDSYEGTYKFTWLQVPLAARFHLIPRGPVELIAFLGPVFGFNLGASMEAEWTGWGDENLDLKDSGDTDADISPVEFCLGIGLEVGIRLGVGSLFVNVSLTPGISNVIGYDYDEPDPDDPGSIGFDDRAKMDSFQALFGYAIYFPFAG